MFCEKNNGYSQTQSIYNFVTKLHSVRYKQPPTYFLVTAAYVLQYRDQTVSPIIVERK